MTNAVAALENASTDFNNIDNYMTGSGFNFYSENRETARENKRRAITDYLAVYSYYNALYESVEYAVEVICVQIISDLLNQCYSRLNTYNNTLDEIQRISIGENLSNSDKINAITTKKNRIVECIDKINGEISNIEIIRSFFDNILRPTLNNLYEMNNNKITPSAINPTPTPTIQPSSNPHLVVPGYTSRSNQIYTIAPVAKNTQFELRIQNYSDNISEIIKQTTDIYQDALNKEITFYSENASNVNNLYSDFNQEIITQRNDSSRTLISQSGIIRQLNLDLSGGYNTNTHKNVNGLKKDFTNLTIDYIPQLQKLHENVNIENDFLKGNVSETISESQRKYYQNQTINNIDGYRNIFYVIYIILFFITCYSIYLQNSLSIYAKTFSVLFFITFPFWIYSVERFTYARIMALFNYLAEKVKIYYSKLVL
jgi:hypothetical protein